MRHAHNSPTCPACGTPEVFTHPRSEAQPFGLLPVHDPLFNLEQACIEAILLEQHLFDVQKRCADCIIKHFLTIEGLLREIPSLDKRGIHTDKALSLAGAVRGIREQWRRTQHSQSAGQAVRNLRKHLAPYCLPIGGPNRG